MIFVRYNAARKKSVTPRSELPVVDPVVVLSGFIYSILLFYYSVVRSSF